MNENEMAESSAAFIEKFAALSKRLASINVTVHTADLQWGSFGSWTLMIIKRHEAVRFLYDGRDSFITVEASPMRQYSYPNEWKELVVKGIDNRQDEAIAFVEDFIRKRFTA